MKNITITLFIIIVILLSGCSRNKLIKSNPENSMILVKGGVFSMGDNTFSSSQSETVYSELPHPVILTDFLISKYEVTQKEYLDFCSEYPEYSPCWLKKGTLWNNQTGMYKTYRKYTGERNLFSPVIGISWFDALHYCNWKSEKEGLAKCYRFEDNKISCDFKSNGYRLPTEAEWEYAAKGGLGATRTSYSGSDRNQKVAWFSENSMLKIHQVGTKEGNELGIHDMSGNVYEWCWDFYSSSYYVDMKTVSNVVYIENPVGPVFGKNRVIRGGSWKSSDVFITTREYLEPGKFRNDLGIRLVRSIPQ